MRVWPNGANIERGDDKAPIPADLAPDELTPAARRGIARAVARSARAARDGSRLRPARARPERAVRSVRTARASAPTAKEKPKRASLFASMDPSTITLSEALALLSLPRVVGQDGDGGEITAQNGRYGPYLKKGTDTRSLGSEDQLFTVTLADAEALFAQPKQRRGRVAKPPLADLGVHPESGNVGPGARRSVRAVRHGRYDERVGPGAAPIRSRSRSSRVLNCCERAARAPATKRSVKKAAKRAAKKSTVKARKSTAKKATAKKTAAKKTAKHAEKVAGKATLSSEAAGEPQGEPAMPEEEPAASSAPFIPRE